MSSINGIHSFDSTGTYTEIIPQEKISYIIPEDIYTDETGKTHQAAERKVTIMFKKSSLWVIVTEVFDAEELNSQKQQQSGWQAILENFREYVESQPSDSIRTS